MAWSTDNWENRYVRILDSDGVLKAYGKRNNQDGHIHILNMIENGGFDPYYWISRALPCEYMKFLNSGVSFRCFQEGIGL